MSKPFPPKPDEPQLGLYQHFKGGIYLVVGFAFNAETEAWDVMYVNAEGVWCTRSVRNFLSTSLLPGSTTLVPRFKRVDA